MCQVKLQRVPPVFRENVQVHTHNPRQSDHFHVPVVTLNADYIIELYGITPVQFYDYMKRRIRHKGVIHTVQPIPV